MIRIYFREKNTLAPVYHEQVTVLVWRIPSTHWARETLIVVNRRTFRSSLLLSRLVGRTAKNRIRIRNILSYGQYPYLQKVQTKQTLHILKYCNTGWRLEIFLFDRAKHIIIPFTQMYSVQYSRCPNSGDGTGGMSCATNWKKLFTLKKNKEEEQFCEVA